MTAPETLVTDERSVEDPGERGAARLPWWPVAGLIVLSLLAMGRVVGNDFLVWDDNATIFRNEAFNPPQWSRILKFWDPRNPAASLWVPVTYTVWGLLAQLSDQRPPDAFGARLNPAIFHGASLLLHVLNSLAVWVLIRKLLRRSTLGQAGNLERAAFIGAALFAVHPLQVETVAWASGLKDLLWTTFALLSVLAYLRWLDKSDPWWWRAGLVLFALGTLSKPSAVVTPALIIVVQGVILRQGVRKSLRDIWPWFGWTLLTIAWSVRVQPGVNVDNFPWYLRPLVATDALAFYLYKLVWPAQLLFDYGRYPAYALQQGWLWWTWVFPVGLGCLLAWRARRSTSRGGGWELVVGGAMWAVVALGPVLGLRAFHYQFFTTVADHYVYCAMAGVGLFSAWAMARVPVRLQSLATTSSIIVLTALTLRSFLICENWSTSEVFFTRTLQANPRSVAAMSSLATLYLLDPVTESSPAKLVGVIRLLDRAIQVRPEYPKPYDTKASALVILARRLKEAGDVAGAQQAVEEAVRTSVLSWETSKRLPPELRGPMSSGHILFGDLFFARREHAKALEHYLAAKVDMDYFRDQNPTVRRNLEASIEKTRHAMQATATQPTSATQSSR